MFRLFLSVYSIGVNFVIKVGAHGEIWGGVPGGGMVSGSAREAKSICYLSEVQIRHKFAHFC